MPETQKVQVFRGIKLTSESISVFYQNLNRPQGFRRKDLWTSQSSCWTLPDGNRRNLLLPWVPGFLLGIFHVNDPFLLRSQRGVAYSAIRCWEARLGVGQQNLLSVCPRTRYDLNFGLPFHLRLKSWGRIFWFSCWCQRGTCFQFLRGKNCSLVASYPSLVTNLKVMALLLVPKVVPAVLRME